MSRLAGQNTVSLLCKLDLFGQLVPSQKIPRHARVSSLHLATFMELMQLNDSSDHVLMGLRFDTFVHKP